MPSLIELAYLDPPTPRPELTGLPCCPRGIGGVRSVWVIDRSWYQDLCLDGLGIIYRIKLAPAARWLRLEINEFGANFTLAEENDENGVKYIHTVTGVANILSAEARFALEKFRRRELLALVEDNNGRVWFLGEHAAARLVDVSGATGVSTPGQNIYNFQIIEENDHHCREVRREYLETPCIFLPDCREEVDPTPPEPPCLDSEFVFEFTFEQVQAGWFLGLPHNLADGPCPATLVEIKTNDPEQAAQDYAAFLTDYYTPELLQVTLEVNGATITGRVNFAAFAAFFGIPIEDVRPILCGAEGAICGEGPGWGLPPGNIEPVGLPYISYAEPGAAGFGTYECCESPPLACCACLNQELADYARAWINVLQDYYAQNRQWPDLLLSPPAYQPPQAIDCATADNFAVSVLPDGKDAITFQITPVTADCNYGYSVALTGRNNGPFAETRWALARTPDPTTGPVDAYTFDVNNAFVLPTDYIPTTGADEPEFTAFNDPCMDCESAESPLYARIPTSLYDLRRNGVLPDTVRSAELIDFVQTSGG